MYVCYIIYISVIYIHNPPHIFLVKESADPRALKMGSVLKDPGVFNSLFDVLENDGLWFQAWLFFFQSPFPLKRCTNPSRSPTWFKRNIEGGGGKKGNSHDVPSKTTPTWMKKRGLQCRDQKEDIVGVDNPSWDVKSILWMVQLFISTCLIGKPSIFFVKPYNLVCWTAFHGKSHIVWFNTTIVWIGIFLLGLVSIQTTKKHVLMISPSKAVLGSVIGLSKCYCGLGCNGCDVELPSGLNVKLYENKVLFMGIEVRWGLLV